MILYYMNVNIYVVGHNNNFDINVIINSIKQMVGTITTYYCCNINNGQYDNYIELIPNDKKIYTKYNLIDKTKYIYTWQAYNNLVKYVLHDSIHICIDIANSELMEKININDEITDIINCTAQLYNNIPGAYEKIYVINDIFAIGTPNVMKQYMSLFEKYGSYNFKNIIRNNINGTIIPYSVYNDLTEHAGLKTYAQLFEHIYAYGDKIYTNILNVNNNCGITQKKKHIIIVTYYGIREIFIYVQHILELMGYTIHNFSSFEINNKGGESLIVTELTKMIIELQPEYVLWWIININETNIHKLNINNTKHIYYNWDDPYNWICNGLQNKINFFNTAFITCEETTIKYIDAGTKYAYCVYPGYSPLVHKPYWITGEAINYEQDISFVCTNLYENLNVYPDQLVNRKQLVDTLYKSHTGITFKIYGPEKLKNKYPLSYGGFIKYADTVHVFNKSKINLCTHVVGNKQGYLNERVFLIMGSGGLLLVDNVPGVDNILINGFNCIFIEPDNIVQQVKNIIDNYDDYDIIKRNAYETSKLYTWDMWGIRIEEKLLMNKN